MLLWPDNPPRGPRAQLLYGPNQSDRKISFGKANANFPGTKGSVDELAYVDLDNGNFVATGTISGTNFSGSSSGTNTGDQDLSGYSTTSHNHDDRYYTESEIINSEQWHSLGSTQGASPSYPYRYYRITNDLTFDNNRAYEIMIDADDTSSICSVIICLTKCIRTTIVTKTPRKSNACASDNIVSA